MSGLKMDQYMLKSSISIVALLIVSQLTAAKYINYESNHMKAIAEQLYDKRIDFQDDRELNSITDDDSANHIIKHRKLSKKKYISISGGPVVLSVGDSIDLKCSSLGSPTPVIYWVRREEIEIFKEIINRHEEMTYSKVSTSDNIGLAQSKYAIECASKQDEGEIYCISIIDGEILTASVNVTVKTSGISGHQKYCDQYRKPVIIDSLNFLFAEQGGTVSLPCGVKNADKSSILWMIQNDNEISNISPQSRFHVRNGELVIKNIEWEHMNQYVCMAVNDYGQDQASTFLYPLLEQREE